MNRQEDPLDDQLRAYYEAQRLDDETLRVLKETIDASPRSRLRRPMPLRRQAVRWMAAAVVLCALAIALLVGREDAPRWVYGVAEEIALNHNKRLDSEYAAADFPALGASMSKLDFTLVRPARLERAGLHLVGGRYCSIGDAIAAQVRLLDPAGRPATLYQFRGSPRLSEDVVLDVDGVRVTLWYEAGLLMGLAQSAP